MYTFELVWIREPPPQKKFELVHTVLIFIAIKDVHFALEKEELK